MFISFACTKETNQRKVPHKANLKLSLVTLYNALSRETSGSHLCGRLPALLKVFLNAETDFYCF